MAIVWTPSTGALPDVTRPAVVSISISASDDTSGPADHIELVSSDLPDTFIVTKTAPNTMQVTGPTEDLFPSPNGILYVVDTVLGQGFKISDIPKNADPYEWLPSGIMRRMFTFTLAASALTNSAESGTFTLTVLNNLDAHRTALLKLIAKDY
jgi:hypothetical protein